jgi:predicted nucleic acid-binding protein
MRFVLDTDVIVAALRSPAGRSAELVRAVRHGGATMPASVPLFIEYEAVLKRAEHLMAAGLSAGDVDAVLDVLAGLLSRSRRIFSDALACATRLTRWCWRQR